MITLSNFVKQADDYVLLLTMGEHDTADMLPTVDRPFSPEYYPVSVDYGVPAAGSVAINYFTQENFIFVNGAWGKDSVPPVLEELFASKNGAVYTPKAGVDGYDEVTVAIMTERGTVTPTKSIQTVTPQMKESLLSSVTVNAIPEEYIVPSGSTTITTNGTHDIGEFATAVVNVPHAVVSTVVGTPTQIQINEETTKTYYCIEYDELKELMDSSDELVFRLSDLEYTRPLMGVYISDNETYFEIIELLERGASTDRTAGTKFIWVIKNGSIKLEYEEKYYIEDNIKSKIPYNIYYYAT